MKILVVPGLTLPDVTDEQVAQIQAAAGDDSTVTVARDSDFAVMEIVDTDILLGPLNRTMYGAAERLKWVHAIASGVDGYLFPEFTESDVILTGEKGTRGEPLGRPCLRVCCSP